MVPVWKGQEGNSILHPIRRVVFSLFVSPLPDVVRLWIYGLREARSPRYLKIETLVEEFLWRGMDSCGTRSIVSLDGEYGTNWLSGHSRLDKKNVTLVIRASKMRAGFDRD